MPPFYGDNEQQIFESVIKSPLDFQSDPWPKISEPAKVGLGGDLIGLVGMGSDWGRPRSPSLLRLKPLAPPLSPTQSLTQSHPTHH
jgi:hypothetical protein